MAVRFISKGRGKNRKSFPIKPKKGVSVRSVSLRPSSVAKVNKEQIKLLNKGVPATFSKALNQVVMRAKRNGVPTYDTHVNTNNRRKPYIMHVTDMKKHKKIKGSDTIVMADSYGQAIDDFITIWNKDPNRMKDQIGYPVVQGTAMKDFRYARYIRDVGDVVMVSPENDNDGYNDFKGKKLRITHVTKSSDEHPAFDEGMAGEGLYDLETLDGEQIGSALYDYELVDA